MKDEKCMRVDRPYIAAAELIGFKTVLRTLRGLDLALTHTSLGTFTQFGFWMSLDTTK